MAGHVQLQQPVRGRLATSTVASDMLTRRRWDGDRREVIDFENPPRLFVNPDRFVAPAEVACGARLLDLAWAACRVEIIVE